MHRLKEWFGIKDWQGPERKEESVKPETQQLHVQNNLDNTTSKVPINQEIQQTKPPTVAEIVTALKENQNDESIFLKYNKNFESWLRQYIPVKGNECAQCKLVTTVFLGTLLMPVLYKMYNLEYVKALQKSLRIRVKLVVISFGWVSYSLLYERLFRVGIFMEGKEGEEMKHFLKRVLVAEKERFTRKTKSRNDNNTESDME